MNKCMTYEVMGYPVKQLSALATKLGFGAASAVIRARGELIESRKLLAGIRAGTHVIVPKERLTASMRFANMGAGYLFCITCQDGKQKCTCVVSEEN